MCEIRRTRGVDHLTCLGVPFLLLALKTSALAQAPGDPELRFQQQDERIQALTDEVKQLKEAQAEQELERIKQTANEEQKLRIYGFTDILFYRFFQDEEDPLYGMMGATPSSFSVWHLNTYFDRQVTDSLRMIAEIRFMANPTGDDLNYETPAGGSYERVNTLTYDSFTGEKLNWGGIAIERAVVEYKFMDALVLKAGHYLTPYGIWNEDHGSTVILTVRQPMVAVLGIVPASQTGLVLSGRLFPNPRLLFDYALTVSNGRGPYPRLKDIDDNKEVGLKLKLSWQGPVQLSLGSYLFTGESTDVNKKIDSFAPMHWTVSRTTWFDEMGMAFDLLLAWKGLKLQAEYARVAIDYRAGHHPASDPSGTSFLPDYVEEASYVLLSYRLPLSSLRITPYLMLETYQNGRFAKDDSSLLYTVGVNWGIHTNLVLKLDATCITFPDEVRTRNWQIVGSQLALSF